MHTYISGKIPAAQYPQWYIQDAKDWTAQELTLIGEYMQEVLQRHYDEKGYADSQNNRWYVYKIRGSSFHAHKLTFTHGAPSGKTLHDLKRSLEMYYGFRNKDGEEICHS